ncbi:alpha/beta hydrolase [Streptomyces sp. MB09-02B]|uniref:alpha/beta hydrolase n=1 Tax=Streptomyces sp. MB09-02B TaxID=3028667 RepID=UPI0039AF65C7
MSLTIHNPDDEATGPPPPFDPELKLHLRALQEFVAPDGYRLETLAQMRRMVQEEWPGPSDADLRRDGRFEVSEVSAPGPDGAPDIRLLVCRPTGAHPRLPAVYFVHGGGMILGDNRAGIQEVLDWAEALGLVVVSVEYRLAPETRHPGPVEDCYAGLTWTAAHAAELGIDAQKIIVAGESAGGGLAAALVLLARDRGGPAIHGQLLNAPMLDDRNDSVSARQMAGVGSWDRVSNENGWTALLGEARGGPDVPQYAAAARAEDLGGLPPTYIDVGSAETFRDEDVAYASRIWAAGGTAELHVWPGAWHGFTHDAPTAVLSVQARAARLAWLRRLLVPHHP